MQFAPSAFLSLGVEIEVQLLHRGSGSLICAAPALLRALRCDSSFKPELFMTMLEFCTARCNTLAEVREQLGRSAVRLLRAADALGVDIAGAGTHPFSGQGRPEQVWPVQRYRRTLERSSYLAHRANTFGLHVHVGACSGDHAIQLLNGVSPYLPLLLALSASSPCQDGVDTGLASSRVINYESKPTSGPAPSLRNWDDFTRIFNSLLRSGSIESAKDLHWDIRPHPALGTVEVRICDGTASVADACALAAVIQALFAHVQRRLLAGEQFQPPEPWRLRENKWRALRWGVEGDVIINDQGETRPMKDEIHDMLAMLRPRAARLGTLPELVRAAQLADYPEYQVQRDLLQRGASLRELSGDMVRRWRQNPAGVLKSFSA